MLILVRALVAAIGIAATAAQDAVKLDPAPSTCGALGDIDGDGDLDLVVGHEDRPLSLLVNDGRGAFTLATGAFATAEGKVSALALFDADGDGDLDVIVGSRDVLTRLWLNQGKRGFIDVSGGRLPTSKLWVSAIATGDLDGDGDLDCVIAAGNSDALVFRNDGSQFVAVTDALPPNLREVTALVLADLDGDKDLDVLFGQRPNATGGGGRNRAARNDGHGKFSDATDAWMPSANYSTMALALADIDGDGNADLVCANRGASFNAAARSSVHRWDKGKFWASVATRYAGNPAISQAVALGDVDGDGDVDIVFGNNGPDILYLNDSQKKLVASSALPRHEDDTRTVLLADLDGDGDLDIVTVNCNAPVRYLLNAGAGQFGGSGGGSGGGGPPDKPVVPDRGTKPAPSIGSVAAGKYAPRTQPRQWVGESAPRKAIDAALLFLADHQADDGAFRVATFVDSGDPPIAGTHDVGVTALVVLCLLAEGAGQSHAEAVSDGVLWLIGKQQTGGLMGPSERNFGIYDHAMATLAIAEAYVLMNDAALLPPLQKALDEIARRRNPDGGFGYPRQQGERFGMQSDASVTVCCALAQIAGIDAGLVPGPDAIERTLRFLHNLTDSSTGRTGYDQRGGLAARYAGESSVKYPADKSDALTGASLFVRLALHDDPAAHEDMRNGIEWIAKRPPKLEPDGYFDPYAWFHMAHALCQLGDAKQWGAWRIALHEALIKRQRTTGKRELIGSWDPDEPWGTAGGRFASTALATLALQAEYRFAKLADPHWRRKVK